MSRLARSPLAPVLGKHLAVRGSARLLYRSYAAAAGPDLPSRHSITRHGDRFDVDLSSFLEWQLWAFGGYEDHLAALFTFLARRGDRCIDVGANIGIHTVRLAKLVGAQGEVVAFEPDADLARKLRRNIALNDLTHVRIVGAAASDHSGSVTLYRPDTQDPNKGRASMLPHAYLTGPSTTVPCVTIDEVAAGPVSVMKIDVEGNEAAVLAGAGRTIEQQTPAIVFEYDPALVAAGGASAYCHLDWLGNAGYAFFAIRSKRHSLGGRGALELGRLQSRPDTAVNLVAVPGPMTRQLGDLVRS